MVDVRPDPLKRPFELLVPTGVVVALTILTVDRARSLPDTIAIRWSSNGAPMAAGSRDFELVGGILIVAMAAWGFVLLADRLPTITSARVLVALGHITSVILAGQRARTILANIGAPHWSQATPTISVWWIAAAGGVAGLIGWQVSSSRGRRRGSTGLQPPTE